MMTVKEVSRISGVSVRALHYYDENSLRRLQDIMLFRELEFPLADIKRIIDSPGFDRRKALEDQIQLLKLISGDIAFSDRCGALNS